jgi:hypothetical protein
MLEGNMNHQAMGKKETLEGGGIMKGAMEQPLGSREQNTGPPVAQSTHSHTNIMLARNNIKCARLPPTKFRLPLGMYSIIFHECVLVYSGQTVVTFRPKCRSNTSISGLGSPINWWKVNIS